MINNKDKFIKNIVISALTLIILIVEGCFNFATLDWNFTTLGKVDFWIGIVTKLLLLLLVRMLALMIFQDIARNKNQNLLTEINLNNKLMKMKDADFPIWVENDLNLKIKIEAWKLSVNKKLNKLEKRAKEADRMFYYSKKLTVEEKQENKYCRLKMMYLEQLTDEYINENIDMLMVKYNHVDSAVFDLPVNLATSDNKYQLTAKTRSAIIFTLGTSSIWLLLTTIIRNAMEFQKNDAAILAILISLALDLIFLLMQFFSGMMDAFKIIDTQEVLPYVNRNRILREYLYDKEPEQRNRIKEILDSLN